MSCACREWSGRKLAGARAAIYPHAYNEEFVSPRALAPPIIAIGMRLEPHVPGVWLNTPLQDMPHLSHFPSGVRCQAVISHQSRPISNVWQLWQ